MFDERLPGPEHMLILFGGDASKIAGADVDRALSQGAAGITESVTGHERLIHGDIAAVQILDEERDIRSQIEERLQGANVDRPRLGNSGGWRHFCARFHVSRGFPDKKAMRLGE